MGLCLSQSFKGRVIHVLQQLYEFLSIYGLLFMCSEGLKITGVPYLTRSYFQKEDGCFLDKNTPDNAANYSRRVKANYFNGYKRYVINS